MHFFRILHNILNVPGITPLHHATYVCCITSLYICTRTCNIGVCSFHVHVPRVCTYIHTYVCMFVCSPRSQYRHAAQEAYQQKLSEAHRGERDFPPVRTFRFVAPCLQELCVCVPYTYIPLYAQSGKCAVDTFCDCCILN